MTWNRGVTARLTRIFPEVLHVDPPPADADLFESGLIDSLAFVELLMKLEQEFGVSVAVDDLERMVDVTLALVDVARDAP